MPWPATCAPPATLGKCGRSSGRTLRKELDRLAFPEAGSRTQRDADSLKRLRLLARLHGLQQSYWDGLGRRREPGPDAIAAVLRALGAEITGPADVEDAIEARRRHLWHRPVEPVCVWRENSGAPGGDPGARRVGPGAGREGAGEPRRGSGVLRLRVPARHAEAHIRCEIIAENGEVRAWEERLSDIASLARGIVDKEAHLLKHLPLPEDLPLGYHRCRVSVGGKRAETLIIAAPAAAATPEALGLRGGWGAFLPLYALRTEEDWGVGDFNDLAALARWIGKRGGNTVATLPLLPTDSAALSGPSPYSPVSRLFWSELFVDLRAIPELRDCASAERLLESAPAQRHLAELRASERVDYAAVAGPKRTLLSEMASVFLAATGGGERRGRFERFIARRPEVVSYARFRAALQRHGRPWADWPAKLRDGDIGEQDYDDALYRSHLFGQWLAHEQLDELALEMRERDMALYLDLPLGVPWDSFDVWRHREQFTGGVSAGAPPDGFFMQGQNWALPPAHPERSRELGYGYLRACLRHHLATAGMLRIDHVMALHRLFWVPDGFPATEGVYVRYPARELWAILALESRRNHAVIVGEDLGTVPPAVRRAMRQNRTHRIFVLQTEIAEDRLPCLDPPAPDSIACMNTHDMPTFASYRQGSDLRDLAELGALDDDAVAVERRRRADKLRVLSEFLRHGGWLTDGRTSSVGGADAADVKGAEDAEVADTEAAEVLRACLRFMAESEAAELIVNLEDLWLEQQPQNVPGTSHERPNWSLRARHSLAEMMQMPDVVDALRDIDRARRRRISPEPSGG